MANKKKIPVYVAFGSAARNWAEEHEEKFLTLKKRKQFPEDSGYADVLYFNTDGEVNAYMKGLEDMNGWENYYATV